MNDVALSVTTVSGNPDREHISQPSNRRLGADSGAALCLNPLRISVYHDHPVLSFRGLGKVDVYP